MEILNKVGKEVLEYKVELLKPDHSDIVKRALQTAVTALLSGEIINVDIHDALRDDELSVRDVRSLVLGVPQLRKTEAELKDEYDCLLEPFHKKLAAAAGISDPNYARLSSESHVHLGEVQFILSFEMTKDFIGKYFERDGDELDLMMRPEGFAEKFAILRYGALMTKFLRSQAHYDELKKRVYLGGDVEIGATKVYVNKDEELYGVELVYHIPIEELEDDSRREKLLPILEKSIQDANEFINIRTIA